MKTKIGLLYGGKSAEHHVSMQTALAVTEALDYAKFEVHPIYITEEGEWIKGHQLNAPAESVASLAFSRNALSSPGFHPEVFQAEESALDIIFPLLHARMAKMEPFKECLNC